MSIRKRIGFRRHSATFYRHDGSVDSYGQPTYADDSSWTAVSSGWPCELVTTVGGEVLRGRMVTEKTTHVAFGEFFGIGSITVKDRCIIDGVKYGITNTSDPDGISMEIRVELRGENNS